MLLRFSSISRRQTAFVPAVWVRAPSAVAARFRSPLRHIRALLLILILPLLALAPATSRAADSLPLFLLPQTETQARVFFIPDFVLLRPRDFPLAPAIENAYRQADALVLPLKDDPDPAQAFEDFFAANARSRTPLGQQLAPDLHTRFQKVVRALGVPPERFEILHPWAAGVVTYQLFTSRTGIQPRYGLETYFRTKAQVDEKEILGVRPAGEFLEDLADMTAEDQAAYLRQTLNEIALMHKYRDELRVNWQIGDIEELGDMIERTKVDNPEMNSRLHEKPAGQWVQALEILRQERPGQTLFAVIPLNMLLGEGGTLFQMRKKYEKLQQIPAGVES